MDENTDEAKGKIRGTRIRRACAVIAAFSLGAAVLGSGSASAAQAPVGLGTSRSFAVLAGSEVTNTGPSSISGDIGLSPGTSVTGFPPGQQVSGTTHKADAVASQAQIDMTTAYNDAAGRTPFATVATELGGTTLVPGVYRGATLGITGTLTLDAKGDPNAVFIFQAGSTLITASGSRVTLINGASPCNVFWQVPSTATLGTNSTFIGTVLAQTSIAAQTGAAIQGRLFASTAAVTLDRNTITNAGCAGTTPSTTTTTTSTPVRPVVPATPVSGNAHFTG